MKAEAEQAVSALQLPAVQTFRPSLLLASRSDSRPAEAALQRLTPGVARHMTEVAKAEPAGVRIHYSHT